GMNPSPVISTSTGSDCRLRRVARDSTAGSGTSGSGAGRRGLAAVTSVKVLPSASWTSTRIVRVRSWVAWSRSRGDDARVQAAAPGPGSYSVPSMTAVIDPSTATVSTTNGRSTGD